MSCLSRTKRGRYATNACTNCRKKHLKCSQGATCTNCALHNLECVYINPVKKRGPRTVNKSTYVFESNFGGAASIEQEHTLISTEHQFDTSAFSDANGTPQPTQSEFFLNQEYIEAMSNNNTPINFSSNFFLPNNPSSSSIASNLDYLFEPF
ncbi:9851_t:CDS:1 [Dentiscutata heterogama]|uniref:9851_t:CDS:1 n=1 Tax=Dentiscutata heterogama TaxID=1316150 RepID=A0ACA9NZN1_9GLOM|nr:9851_t:CDS:1 [Dentiscutata heterogama]